MALACVLALSVGWTVAVVQPPEPRGTRPAALPVAQQPPEWPASASVTARLALGTVNRGGIRVVDVAPAEDIPTAALAAYQRAEAVINVADKSCHLPWQLLAAIGRVESDHGRVGGNVVDADGISLPGVLGPQLDGDHGTALVSDTDAGRLDEDTAYDRAVGPMQFIPTTWTEVAVDADGDGRRNPQDIDDAALAAAVYLCSGPEDLSTRAGQRRSVLRYNRSRQYVELVLSVMESYQQGAYAEAPNGVTSPIALVALEHAAPLQQNRPQHGPADDTVDNSSSAAQSPQPPPNPGAGPGGSQESPPVEHQPLAPVKTLVDEATTAAAETVTGALTLAQAITVCTASGHSPLLGRTSWRACIARHTS